MNQEEMINKAEELFKKIRDDLDIIERRRIVKEITLNVDDFIVLMKYQLQHAGHTSIPLDELRLYGLRIKINNSLDGYRIK